MMLISPIAALLLHFLLTTTVHAYSENAVYQPSRSKGERLFLNLRSGVDTERSTRRIFAQNPIRFGGRSDIPPLVGKAMEYEAMIDDELSSRERRAFNKGNHMRFGRANSNFLRFGKSRNNKNSDYNRLTRANNSLFMRFGRGRNDFLRFGRSEEFSRNKRDTSTVDDVQKRGNNNFMRFGKRYNYEENVEEFPNFTEEQTKTLEDALLFKLLSQISCNMESANCDERLD
ncbi:fmrfamide related peptide family [Holotrichia oblita]|uniref:Fmrfamide related peptide family n=1 Tax=Holotrichia oblita TaxID=644536 RepID=A0ACB9T9L5_HOLOL|nr:fmrfamide related peptide family [Holotrichia oblita]